MQKKTSGCAWLFLIGFIVSIFIVALGTDSNSGTSSSEPDPRTDAIVMANHFVEKNLKSPRSAKFPRSADEYQVYALEGPGFENSYEVTGYVDAQNSFGADIRSRFIVQIKDLGNEEWRLLDIDIN